MVKIQSSTVSEEELRFWLAKLVILIPEKISEWSVGVERKHSVTISNASFMTLSMRRVCKL